MAVGFQRSAKAVWFRDSLRLTSGLERARGFFVQREPPGRNREITIGVGAVAAFDLLAKSSPALRFDEVPHRLVNEPAPRLWAPLGRAVPQSYRKG